MFSISKFLKIFIKRHFKVVLCILIRFLLWFKTSLTFRNQIWNNTFYCFKNCLIVSVKILSIFSYNYLDSIFPPSFGTIYCTNMDMNQFYNLLYKYGHKPVLQILSKLMRLVSSFLVQIWTTPNHTLALQYIYRQNISMNSVRILLLVENI